MTAAQMRQVWLAIGLAFILVGAFVGYLVAIMGIALSIVAIYADIVQ